WLAHLIDRRPHAQARDARPRRRFAIDAHVHRENALDRADSAPQSHVRGGIAQLAAQVVAMRHAATYGERAPQQFPRTDEIAGRQPLANAAGRYPLAITLDRRHGARRETEFGAHRLQQGEVAAALVAEAKIASHPDFARA